MLADYASGRKQGPLTPEGWVFIADALIAAMDSFDEQRAKAGLHFKGREPSVWSTYQDLAALDPRDSTNRVLARREIAGERFENLQSSAYGASALLAKACEAGRIKTATRRVGGGPLLKQPSSVWGLDWPWRRFWSCQMDPISPFYGTHGHWIFFEAGALYIEIDRWRVQHFLAPMWTRPASPHSPADLEPSSDVLGALPAIEEVEPSSSNGPEDEVYQPEANNKVRGTLPASAKPNDFRYEEDAHKIAEIVQKKKIRFQSAAREHFPTDKVGLESAIRATRQAYDLMYDIGGRPIKN